MLVKFVNSRIQTESFSTVLNESLWKIITTRMTSVFGRSAALLKSNEESRLIRCASPVYTSGSVLANFKKKFGVSKR